MNRLLRFPRKVLVTESVSSSKSEIETALACLTQSFVYEDKMRELLSTCKQKIYLQGKVLQFSLK